VLVQGHWGSPLFSAAVFAEEVDVRDEESGDITTVDVQALLEAFLNIIIIIIIIIIVVVVVIIIIIIIIIIILEIITKIIMYMFLRSACYIDEVFIG